MAFADWQGVAYPARWGEAEVAGLRSSLHAVIRRFEDLDSAALTYAEVKAIPSGNLLAIEKAKVDAELIRLTLLRSA